MSLATYFLKRSAELRMPTTRDPLGIHYDGPVLNGYKSVQQAQREAEIRNFAADGPSHEILSGKTPALAPPSGLEPAARGTLPRPGTLRPNARQRRDSL